MACLQLDGDERVNSPYESDLVALPVANRIATLAGTNFLIAGLVVRGHGLYDEHAVDASQISAGQTVGSALNGYLDRVGRVGALNAAQVLTGLAFAEAPGLTISTWATVVDSLFGQTVTERELRKFARSSAANFLVESSLIEEDPSFRLFHQALNETLLSAQARTTPRSVDERNIAHALIDSGRVGWMNAPEYMLRSLPGHAALGGVIDELLGDDRYLLHVDLWRLIHAAGGAKTVKAKRRAQLLGIN